MIIETYVHHNAVVAKLEDTHGVNELIDRLLWAEQILRAVKASPDSLKLQLTIYYGNGDLVMLSELPLPLLMEKVMDNQQAIKAQTWYNENDE